MPALRYNTAAKHAVMNAPGTIESIFVAGGTMGQIDLYDAVDDDSGTSFCTVAVPAPGMIVPKFFCSAGLTMKLAAATEVLVQRSHLAW